eukprot:TRINITY_DN4527_c0_g4_i1.p1 TRINITY_DN4527_c0_g4~~TRINITY_DN4527_c0_g4_i1.p1  ORF type:complete len:207 (+),score=-28.93 TRINITY_DN4527_c0_g4_i1:754-1374(+)
MYSRSPIQHFRIVKFVTTHLQLNYKLKYRQLTQMKRSLFLVLSMCLVILSTVDVNQNCRQLHFKSRLWLKIFCGKVYMFVLTFDRILRQGTYKRRYTRVCAYGCLRICLHACTYTYINTYTYILYVQIIRIRKYICMTVRTCIDTCDTCMCLNDRIHTMCFYFSIEKLTLVLTFSFNFTFIFAVVKLITTMFFYVSQLINLTQHLI